MYTPEFKIKYVLIDDDDIDRIAIETESSKFSFLQKVADFSNPVEALDFFSDSEPDIVFLDIEMPGLTGIEFLKQKHFTSAIVIFITSHPEFALEGYELQVFDYLIKPVTTERFSRCALRLHDFFQMKTKAYAFDSEQEKDTIVIKQGYDKYRITIADILYLEAMKDYTRIMTPASQYLVLTTLSALKEKLPADTFIQVHRSYVVNKNKVDALEKNKLHILSYVLPVGKLYKHVFNFLG